MGDPMTADDFDRLSRRHKHVVYSDYKPKDDFTLWITGFREKVRAANDFTQRQEDEVDEKVVKLISSKLTSGTALDTYNRLTDDERTNYTTLIQRLTEEFLDPQDKRKFVENFDYNKRKKGQSLKEFRQEIVKDMGKYSGMPDKIIEAGVSVPNPAKEKEGVRRFKKGMRTRRGEKDKDLMIHMKFHICKDKDLTWAKALEAAERWETANDTDSSSDASDSKDSETEEVKAVDVRRGAKSKRRSKSGRAISAVETATEAKTEVATIADQVKTNTMDIKSVKTEQERASVKMEKITESMRDGFIQVKEGFENVLQRLDGQQPQSSGAAGTQPQQQQQRQQSQMQPRIFPQSSGQGNQGFQSRQAFQPRNPTSYTWKGNVGQVRQTGFGLNRRSPQNFPRSGNAPQTNQGNAKSVATVEHEVAESLEEEEEDEDEPSIKMSLKKFRELTLAACLDAKDEDIVASVEKVNF